LAENRAGDGAAVNCRRAVETPGIHRHIAARTIRAHIDSRHHIEEQTMATSKVTKATFQSAVLNAPTPVVVDFWAEWCGPCRMIAPALEELSAEMAGKVSIVKVNIDEEPELGAQYGVRSIPTLLMFKDGQLASNMVGAAPKSKLSSWISSAV
jgi:thioredoxin 1